MPEDPPGIGDAARTEVEQRAAAPLCLCHRPHQAAPVRDQGSEEQGQEEEPRALPLVGVARDHPQDPIPHVVGGAPRDRAPDVRLRGELCHMLHERRHVQRDPEAGLDQRVVRRVEPAGCGARRAQVSHDQHHQQDALDGVKLHEERIEGHDLPLLDLNVYLEPRDQLLQRCVWGLFFNIYIKVYVYICIVYVW